MAGIPHTVGNVSNTMIFYFPLKSLLFLHPYLKGSHLLSFYLLFLSLVSVASCISDVTGAVLAMGDTLATSATCVAGVLGAAGVSVATLI